MSAGEEKTTEQKEEAVIHEENKNEAAAEDREETIGGKIEEAMAKIVSDTVGIQEAPEPKQPQKLQFIKAAAPKKPQERITPEQVKAAHRKCKKRKILKMAGLTAAMLTATIGCAYSAAAYYYSDKFFEGTTINGMNCSGLTAVDVEQKIAGKVEDYSIEVMARDQEPQEIDGEDFAYRYVPDGSIQKLLKQQNPLTWINGYFNEKKYSASSNFTYSKAQLKEQLRQLACAKPENQVAPEDAYVAFGEKEFEIVPETEGSMLNTRKAFETLTEAVGDSAKEVDLDAAGNYMTAAVKKDDPALAATLKSCNLYAKANITYTFGEETEVLDGETIKDWLVFNERKQLVQDDAALAQHIADYVANLAAKYDTIGRERNFHTTSGREIVVSGGNYGWQIDQAGEAAALLEQIKAGEQIVREPVYAVKGYTQGRNDIGSTYVEVDLTEQELYMYKEGALVLETPFVSGNMSYADRVTPAGVCHLYYKQRNQVLRGKKLPDGKYEYEQPVSYWMPFNGGVGLHDANWRSEFGGSIYLTSGSHGCINLPPQKAAELYDLIDTSMPIVAFY